MNENTLDPWVEGYLEYLTTVRRLAMRTVVDIRCTLKAASQALALIRPGKSLWEVSLEDYLVWFNQLRQAGQSVTSVAKAVSHIRGLLEYAWRSGRASRNVLDGFHLRDAHSRVSPRVLTLAEAQQLIEACSSSQPLHRRNRLVIFLLYGGGLRTGELCQLDVPDVDLQRQELMIRKAKGDLQRRVPVPEAVWTQLLAYLAERKGKRGALLRTAVKGRRLASKDVCDIVQAAVQQAKISPEITPKTLRHSFATHLMDQGVDLAVISCLMGHRSPQETGVYLHVLPGKREKAVEQLTISKEP